MYTRSSHGRPKVKSSLHALCATDVLHAAAIELNGLLSPFGEFPARESGEI